MNDVVGEGTDHCTRGACAPRERNKTLIPKQLFQLVPRGVFAGIGCVPFYELALGQFEVFAKVAHGFFENRLRSAVAALVGGARIVT
jgi:hypothetical protein